MPDTLHVETVNGISVFRKSVLAITKFADGPYALLSVDHVRARRLLADLSPIKLWHVVSERDVV
jgi:hypothetical protein